MNGSGLRRREFDTDALVIHVTRTSYLLYVDEAVITKKAALLYIMT
jgi:hypothetical protein